MNEHVFANLNEARQIIEQWRIDYNTNRPHSSLNGLTPIEFATRPDEEQNPGGSRPAWLGAPINLREFFSLRLSAPKLKSYRRHECVLLLPLAQMDRPFSQIVATNETRSVSNMQSKVRRGR